LTREGHVSSSKKESRGIERKKKVTERAQIGNGRRREQCKSTKKPTATLQGKCDQHRTKRWNCRNVPKKVPEVSHDSRKQQMEGGGGKPTKKVGNSEDRGELRNGGPKFEPTTECGGDTRKPATEK